MTATVVTPTSVQKIYKPSTNKYGTPVRLVEYFCVFTKTYQSDWIVAATYTPGTYIGSFGNVIDGSGDGVLDTVTYAATGTKIVAAGTTVGTVYLRVFCLDVGA